MAAMAPALTEAAAEAHERLKLAAPPSVAPGEDSGSAEGGTLLLARELELKGVELQPGKAKDLSRVGCQSGVLLSLPRAWLNGSPAELRSLISGLRKVSSAGGSELPNGLMAVRSMVAGHGRTASLPPDLLAATSPDTAGTRGGYSSGALSVNLENDSGSPAHILNGKRPSCYRPEADLTTRAVFLAGRHAELESRVRRLCRRLQMVQAKQVERHVQQQLRGFLGQSLERAQKLGLPSAGTVCYSSTGSRLTPSSAPSGTALTSFLSEPAVSSDINRLVQSTTAVLRGSERALDSDGTESSSGGETEPEEELHKRTSMHVDDEQRQQYFVLQGESEWKWVMERAAIISRWTWLQAQVSDLEYRIRQQTDMYRQIRCNKGPVVLGDAQQPEDLMKQQCRLVAATSAVNSRGSSVSSSFELKVPVADSKYDMSPCSPSHLLRNVDKQSSRLTQSLGSLMCPSSPVCMSGNGSPVPSKACTPPRHTKSFLTSLHHIPSDSSSLDSIEAEEILSKKQRLDSLTAPPSPPDNSCIAARVRPVHRCKKRRLVRSNVVLCLSRKLQKPLNIKCSCELPNTCILCGCKTAFRTLDPNTMPLQERVAQLDPCFHSILSFPHDHPVHLHFDTLLKEDRPHKLLQKVKALKLSQFKKKPQDSKNVCQKLDSSLLSSAKYGHNKNSPEKFFRHCFESWQPALTLEAECMAKRVNLQMKRPSCSPLHLGSPFKGNRRHTGAASHGLLVPSAQIPKLSSEVHQLSSSSSSCSSSSSSSSMESGLTVTVGQSASPAAMTSQSARKRRAECSFDINNIVIPVSMAASARVEKLQYKEILTPSWRVVDPVEWEARNQVLTTQDEDEELEDCCDEAYLNRHSACEDMERSRWDYWALSSSQRRGSRSSNKADGRLTPQPPHMTPATPQPASPDLGFHSLNDFATNSSSSGPHSPEPFTPQHAFSTRDRTRVLYYSEDTRSSTPEIPDEEVKTVLPWELRVFPLSDQDLEALVERPETPKENICKLPQDMKWHPFSGCGSSINYNKKHGPQTESMDSTISLESLTLTSASKLPLITPNSADWNPSTEHQEGVEGSSSTTQKGHFPFWPAAKR